MSLRKKNHVHKPPLRLGFVALSDCAPIVMAAELDLYAKHGIEVELHREVGWATIRDKVIYGELDAAHAPAGLVVAASCGLGSIQADCTTAMVLNLQGNAITLSEELWKRGVRDGRTLRREIANSRTLLSFGVVHPFSAHSTLLRHWLRSHGIEPERDVRIVVVPPAQVHANLRAGHLDGYCVGEPWNSLAVMSRIGWTVATSMDLAPLHPEKVLMVRSDFAKKAVREHVALIAALIEACAFCDKPENRERLVETLAQSKYVGAPIQALRMGMGGSYDFGHGRVDKHAGFHIFSNHNANEPTPERAAWVIRQLVESRLITDATLIDDSRAAEWFRADIHQQARKLISKS